MSFKMVFLPPGGERARSLAARVGQAVPEARVVVAETEADAEREIVDAEAAWGTISPVEMMRLSSSENVKPPMTSRPSTTGSMVKCSVSLRRGVPVGPSSAAAGAAPTAISSASATAVSPRALRLR